MKTIAQKCRNPLNIRYNPKNNWVGSRGSFKGFVVFSSTLYGYRAALLLLRNYIRKGYNTVESIVNRWAPPSENNTDAYVKAVCKILSCEPTDQFVGTAGLCMLCSAMAVVESGVTAPDVKYLYDICIKYRITVEKYPYFKKHGKEKECVD